MKIKLAIFETTFYIVIAMIVGLFLLINWLASTIGEVATFALIIIAINALQKFK